MEHGGREGWGWHHWGLMLLCCLPMITLGVLLLVGVVSGR